MTFTIDNLINSLAGVLKAKYPEYPVYTSPNQQGTNVPCFFIFLMPSTVTAEVDERFYRDLGIDIILCRSGTWSMGMRKSSPSRITWITA